MSEYVIKVCTSPTSRGRSFKSVGSHHQTSRHITTKHQTPNTKHPRVDGQHRKCEVHPKSKVKAPPPWSHSKKRICKFQSGMQQQARPRVRWMPHASERDPRSRTLRHAPDPRSAAREPWCAGLYLSDGAKRCELSDCLDVWMEKNLSDGELSDAPNVTVFGKRPFIFLGRYK